ncbi:MAG: GNAT family N-acetyltransferase [Pseudomonadota bacterium]
MNHVHPCGEQENASILHIINSAAQAYRGSIPSDCWHEPYMSEAEFRRDLDAGVEFWGYEMEGSLVGVMGIQRVRDVDLIRHAYVLPNAQRLGIGGVLIEHLRRHSTKRMLVGTWADAAWAIEFYRRNGFDLVTSQSQRVELLKTYWTIPDRQIETSVVLELKRVGRDAEI